MIRIMLGQPRCFPLQSNRLLASFAGSISRADPLFAMAIAKEGDFSIRTHHSRQATLHTAYTAMQVHLPFRTRQTRTITGLHANRVGFSMPLGSALRA